MVEHEQLSFAVLVVACLITTFLLGLFLREVYVRWGSSPIRSHPPHQAQHAKPRQQATPSELTPSELAPFQKPRFFVEHT